MSENAPAKSEDEEEEEREEKIARNRNYSALLNRRMRYHVNIVVAIFILPSLLNVPHTHALMLSGLFPSNLVIDAIAAARPNNHWRVFFWVADSWIFRSYRARKSGIMCLFLGFRHLRVGLEIVDGRVSMQNHFARLVICDDTFHPAPLSPASTYSASAQKRSACLIRNNNNNNLFALGTKHFHLVRFNR